MENTIEQQLHHCTLPAVYDKQSQLDLAIDHVYETKDGKLYATNDEYTSRINYCPVCGYKAKVQIEQTIKS